MRPTSAYINTEALKHNYIELSKKLPSSAGMMAVVKANAYGHGDLRVAGILEGLGCGYFGVAIAEEGEKLRNGGILSPIVVLGGVYRDQISDIFRLNLTPVVFDIPTARAIDSQAAKAGGIKDIHVKIDTGMGRLGILPGEVEPFFKELKAMGNLRVQAVLSHFSEAESEDKEYSFKQLSFFNEALGKIRALGFVPELVEMANSAAAVDLPEARFNLVRPGIMLYGSYPAKHFESKISLRPVMEIKTRVLHLKELPAGSAVSYGRRFITKRPSVIATLPIGYADGLPRGLSSRGEVLISGRKAPLVGTICMDLAMCDVTDVPGVRTGDEAVVIGAQGGEKITVEEVAARAGTISYEVLCNISGRVPRIYI